MLKRHCILLVLVTIGFVTVSFAQHQRYAIRNGIGLFGGLTQFDINTDNFKTESSQGWIAGLAATVDLPHKWYTVSYNIQLSQNNLDVYAYLPGGLETSIEPIEYKIFTTQAAFLFHLKLLQDYITIDLGPMLQYNSEMELKNDSDQDKILSTYNNLTADDISNITKFNVNGAVGITAGFKGFKLRGQYIHGFTNILNKLNKDNLDTSGSGGSKFKGNQSMLAFTAMIIL